MPVSEVKPHRINEFLTKNAKWSLSLTSSRQKRALSEAKDLVEFGRDLVGGENRPLPPNVAASHPSLSQINLHQKNVFFFDGGSNNSLHFPPVD
jgi:hypothetical protein